MVEGSAQLAALRNAERTLQAAISGTDEDEIISLEAENQRLTKVTLSREWSEGGVDGLVSAFQGAYEAMSVATKVRYFETLEQARLADLGQAEEPAGSAAAPVELTHAPTMSEADALVEQVVKTFARLEELQRTEPAGTTYTAPPTLVITGTSSNGRVTAIFEVADGDDQLTSFEVDENWLQRQSPLQISEMIKEAVNDAFEAATQVQVEPNAYQQLAGEFSRAAQAARATARRAGLR